MRQGQIISLGIAAVCGLGAVYLLNSFMAAKPKEIIKETTVNATQVLVAKSEIGLGQVVNRENFRWQDWPQGAIRPSVIRISRRSLPCSRACSTPVRWWCFACRRPSWRRLSCSWRD